MAVLPILKYGHPVLRMKASPVKEIDESVESLIENMVETVRDAQGIGLAAPQVGESLALAVVDMGLIEEGGEALAFINPQIIYQEGRTVLEEGCLSVPEIREEVERAHSIVLKFVNIQREEMELQCEGLLARVLQHEIDHLNGVFFVDRIGPMKRRLLSKKLKLIAQGKYGGDL